ncbi:MAG: endonuclease MutS2 [Candidatus Promineifilaceae bacterium]
MDSKSLKIIEFHKVLAKVADYTSFSAGQELTASLAPTIDLREAEIRQAETAEAVKLFQGDSNVTIGGMKDVRRPVGNAQRGFTLLAEDFSNIKDALIAARNLKRVLLREPSKHPHLAEVAELIEECPGLVTTISQTIDERGDVLDTASQKLGKLRQKLRVSHSRIQEKLRALVNSSMNQYLQEPLITIRSGRYVVPLRSEHKGRIKGIIHDQSSSGATLWVEPLNTVELNNEYRAIQIEELKEIERILAALSQKIASYADEIKRVVERMAEIDCIFARARYAMMTDGVKPIFVEWRNMPSPHPGSSVWIRGARHPLLEPNEVVPTDFLVEDDLFTVLLTGPNTGGKTVALKNVALMVAMAQAGLHVPANEIRLTVFDRIFADIGDEQSIEQSLSTFSAHITNITRILNQVDERSLVVLDELGSGTDPTEGAAIAQAIINFLRDKGATSFVATHYPELKIYASQTAGATNASMMFDLDTLSPTYELTIGIPGKSNALAIARRLGLDESILDEAMGLVGVGSQEAESLIDSIFDLRARISAEEAAARLALNRAEKTRDQLAIESAAIEYERRRILEKARHQAEAELEAVRNEIRRARRGLRDAQSISTVKKISKRITDVEEGSLKPLKKAISAEQPNRRRNRRLRVGDNVLIKSLNTKGQIISLKTKEAEVAAGRMTMRVPLTGLEFRGRDEAEEKAKEAASLPSVAISTNVSMELDIRGERVESGLNKLDNYLDTASLGSLPWVRIIHGKGSGRLRQAIRKALGKHHAIASWEEGKDGEGGAGVTIARMKG